MHQTNSNKRNRTVTALLLLLATLALAACGSSSSTSATTATSAGAGTPTRATLAAHFAAVRACLKKDGITLPEATPGRLHPFGGGLLLGNVHPPAGMTRAQFREAIKKCDGPITRRFIPGARGFTTTLGKEALAKFATCMHENGVPIPAPNTSGKGPVFNTSGIDTASAKFRTAQAKCASVLRGLFRARPGAAGPPGGAAGAPGAGAPAAPGEAAPGAAG